MRDVAAVLNLDERIDALRGRVGELRVDPQPQRLRADREGQTRAVAALLLGLLLSTKHARPRTSPPQRARMVAEVEAMYAETRSETGLAAHVARGARRAWARSSATAWCPTPQRGARLPQPSAADRQRPDHLAAVHRRAVHRSARPEAGARRPRVGTGSGYQAAVLAEIVSKVYSIEIIASLGERSAASVWKDLGYRQYRSQDRRRLPGLAGEGALRRHRRHRRRAARAAGARRAAQARRAHGDPGRRQRRDPVPQAASPSAPTAASTRSACCRCASCRWCPGSER